MNLIEQIKVNDVSIDGYQGTYQTESPEWVKVITDSEDKVLAGIKADGTVEWSTGVPAPIREELLKKVDKEDGKSLIDSSFADSQSSVENPEYLKVTTDAQGKILCGIKSDGTVYIPILDNPGIDSKLNEAIQEFNEKAQQIEDDIDAKLALYDEILSCFDLIEDQEGRSEITTDSEGKIISYRDADGVKHENVGIALSNNAMANFQKALKDSNFNPGCGDWSEYLSNDGIAPLHLDLPIRSIINLITDYDLTQLSKKGYGDNPPSWPAGVEGITYDIPITAEFWDM